MRLRNLSIEHLWVYAVIGSCFGYLCALPVEQYDFWNYLKLGADWFQTHRLVTQDLYTFTVSGKQMLNLHWGAGPVYYLIFRAGGLRLLVLLHALLLTAAFLLLLDLAKKTSGNLRIAAGATFLAFLVSATNFALRPQGFSIFFFALTLHLLRTKRLWPIPLVMLLWQNLHGAFVLGVVLVGSEWLGSLVPLQSPVGGEPCDSSKPLPSAASRPLLITLLLTSAVTTLTPLGLRLYPALLTMESTSRASLLTEWDPPSMLEPTGLLFFSALLGLIALSNWRTRRWSRTDLITFFVFTLLALRQQRAVIWWAIATVPLFAETFAQTFGGRESRTVPQKKPWVVNWLIAGLFSLYLVGCLPWLKTRNPLVPSIKRQLIAPDTPVRLAAELKTIPDARRVFNNLPWGGYFMWDLRDDQKTYCNPFVFLFPKVVMGDYLLITNGHAKWQALLDHYRVDTLALSKTDQPFLVQLARESPSWRLVYEDSLGVLFLRRKA